MKTLGIVLIIVLALNLIALTMNLLFSNPYTATITFLAFFATGAWIIGKAIKN